METVTMDIPDVNLTKALLHYSKNKCDIIILWHEMFSSPLGQGDVFQISRERLS
jgi:hypothetical protein